MTKKSESRLARDADMAAHGHVRPKFSERLQADGTRSNKAQAYYANNTCWDDVQVMAQECAQLLPNYAGVATVLGDQRIQAALEDPRRLVNNVKILARDLLSLNTELKGIQADHAGKSGPALNTEEHMAALGIHERYIAFTERHNALITPVFNTICEDIQNAELRLQKAGQENISKELAEDVKDVLTKVDAHLHAPASPLSSEQDPSVLSEATIVG